MTKAIKLEISKIRIDGGTQSRVEINQRIVEEYCEALDNGDEFPPLDVFHDAADYWLADGFHRLEAFKTRKIKRCDVIVHQGGQRAAILWSVGANGRHGLRRSSEDKRKAVLTLLADPEWSGWTNRVIADRCGVDEGTVRKYRGESVAEIPQLRTGADGKTYNPSKHAASDKTTDQPSTSKSADSPNPTYSLDATKWYPVNHLATLIALDPMDDRADLNFAMQYPSIWHSVRGDVLQDSQYSGYKIVPAIPKPAPIAQTPAAPARTYPMAAPGNLEEDKYYPAIFRLSNVHDEAFADRLDCLKCPRYPGNRPVLGQSLNHQAFYKTFRLIAPIIASNDVTPAAVAAEPPTPQRFKVAEDRYYAVDDQHKLIYHDPRLAAETIHAPYRAVSGSDLNHAPAFEAYRLIDADLPVPIIPASPRPAASPTPAPRQTAKRVEDGKFYVTDNKMGGKIFAQAYDTPEAARKFVTDPFHQRVESGVTINEEPRFDHWVIVAPTNGNGNGNGASKPGTPWADKSNSGDGKDSTRSAWEAQGVANAQAAKKLWLNALDFRILVECNLVEVDEELLQHCTKPLKALVIEALHLAAGQIDRAAFGAAVGTFVTAVSERPVRVAEAANQ